MYSLRISSQAGTEPVSLEELKAHLHITSTGDDTVLTPYLLAARQAAELKTGRTLVNTQYALTLNSFYSSHIDLPMSCPMCTHATEMVITYRKTTGDSTTLSSTHYTPEHQADSYGFVRLNYDLTWPDDVQDSEGAVVITFRSGYSSMTPTTSCPEAIKHWIKMRAGQMYEFREAIVASAPLDELKRDYVDGFLDRYVVISL